jgi:hypothetical protein
VEAAELRTLQLQRNAIALTYRDRLQTLLGSEAIARLRQTIQQGSADSQILSDAERQMLSERARRFRNNQTNPNQRGNGNE